MSGLVTGLARVVYYLVIVPAGLAARLVTDPLRLRRPERTNWVSLPPEPGTLDAARRQS